MRRAPGRSAATITAGGATALPEAGGPADAGVTADTSPGDATPVYDWVPWPDTGSSADATPVTPPDEDEGGCSCRAAGGPAGGWVVLLALGLLALVRRRE